MTYEKAKQLADNSYRTTFEIIEDSIRGISREEFEKIPIIDPYTKVAAERYGYCFMLNLEHDFSTYYRMYLICTYVMRDEKPEKIKNI